MDDRNERIAAALEALFRTYPQPDRGDVLDIAIERMERAKVYFDAVADYDIRDIEAASRSFLTGSAPGVNLAFLPPAPLFAGETRRLMNIRTTNEARDRALHPPLPPPDIERSVESQQRVRALMNKTVAGLRGMSEAESAEATARREAQMAATNARFMPDMSDEAMSERLGRKRGFEVGDSEADAA